MTRKMHGETASEHNEMAFAIELARGASVAHAARIVEISEATGYRWAKKPEVRQAVEEVRSAVLQSASSRIIGIAGKAVDTLGQLLGSESEQIRLSASRAVLDGAVKMRQLADLETELMKIREILSALQSNNSRPGT